jgi:Phage major capsid protein E
MPEIINPFDVDDSFSLANMTGAVNLLPNTYGRIRQMGIFKRKGENTQRVIILDEVNGHLTLLPSKPVGSPATMAKRPKGKSRSFIIPHIPYDDIIMFSDIQGKRQAGTVDPETLENVMINRLTTMRNSHAITEEFLAMGGLKGIIIDGDGSELYNLYTEFGITQKVLSFALSVTTTNVASKCRLVKRHIEDNLKGDVMSGVHCLCDENYFDKLIGHAEVEKFFLNHAKALNLAGSAVDPRKGFNFAGITFEEYRANATRPDGATVPFIAEGDAHFFPVGTMNTFETVDAPAGYLDTVNAPAQPIYAKQVVDAKGKFVDILTESNPLPLCKRPGVLVKGTA